MLLDPMSNESESGTSFAASPITVSTLGSWEVLPETDATAGLTRQPVRLALLTVVALERRIDRSRLIGLLWPEHAPEAGRHSLNQALYLVRQALGSDIVESRGESVIASRRLLCDALELRTAVDAGGVHDAMELLRGPFKPALTAPPSHAFEKWADLWDSRVARVARRARLDAMDDHKRAGRYAQALEIAQRWVQEDRYQDEAQHALIELLFLNGHPTDALRQFDAYRGTIREELDVEPLPETVALVARIRQDFDRLEPVGPPAPSGTRVHDTPSSRSDARRWLEAMIGLVVLAVAALAWGAWALRPLGPDENPRLRVAVMTFEDLSVNGSLDIPARGLTRGMIHYLSGIDEIDVVPYHGVSGMGVDNIFSDSVLSSLGAGTAVVGSLEQDRNRVVATIQLIDANAMEYVGSHRLDFPITELPDLADRLAESVARLLRRHLGRQLTLERRRAGASSTESWLAVNRAHDLAEGLWTPHPLGIGQVPEQLLPDAPLALDRADSLLIRASELDPGWPEPLRLRAQVALARAKLLGRGEEVIDYEAQIRQGLVWADSAAALAPDRSDVAALRGILHFELGYTLLVTEPESSEALIASADTLLQRAVSLDESNATAWVALSEIRRRRGDLGGSRLAAIRALEEDIYMRSAGGLYQQIFVLSIEMQDPDAALDWVERATRAFPDDHRFPTGRLAIASITGQHLLGPDSVRAILQQLDAIDPPTHLGIEREYMRVHRLAMAAGALARVDARTEALSLIDSLEAEVARVRAWQGPFGWDEAVVRMILGDTAEATEALGTWLAAYPNMEEYFLESWIFRDLATDARWSPVIQARARRARRR